MQRILHKNEAFNMEIEPVTEAFKSLDEIIDDIQKFPNGIDQKETIEEEASKWSYEYDDLLLKIRDLMSRNTISENAARTKTY